jgi:hypothetical protein
MSPFIVTPKWTLCRGRYCLQPASFIPVIPFALTAATGIPASEGNQKVPVWLQPLINAELVNNDVGLGIAGLGVPILTGGQGACTMEQLNKNPVTDTLATFISKVNPIQFAGSSFNTCLSSWDAGLIATNPLFGLAGPPISLDLTSQGNASNGKPNPAALATYSSLSNFRSDHPNGGLFLLCDGSVQFLNDSIDMSIYTGLSTIQGGETVSGAVGEP